MPVTVTICVALAPIQLRRPFASIEGRRRAAPRNPVFRCRHCFLPRVVPQLHRTERAFTCLASPTPRLFVTGAMYIPYITYPLCYMIFAYMWHGSGTRSRTAFQSSTASTSGWSNGTEAGISFHTSYLPFLDRVLST